MSENNMISRYTTLNEIVANVMNDIGDYDLSSHKRYMQMAIRGLLQMNVKHSTSLRVVYKDVDSLGRIKIDPDYMYYTKVGWVDANGNVAIFGHSDDIALARDVSCGDVENPGLSEESGLSINDLALRGYYFVPHYNDGRYINNLYGYPAGSRKNYFRVDEEHGYIQFMSAISGKVVLEYVSSGISLDGSTYIPREMEEVIINFVHWKRKANHPGFTRGDRADAKDDYYESLREYADYIYIPTADELLDALYHNERQTMRR